MFPPEITVEDLLLIIALAAILSLLIASLVRRQWHRTPLSRIGIFKEEKHRGKCQTALVILLTYLVVYGLWLLCSIPEVSETLHNLLFTTALFPFKGFMFTALFTALLGWVISAHLHRTILTEEKLHVSEERFRRIFEHSATGMMLLGQNGCFIGLNRAFCQMVGYEESELLNVHFTQITHPDDRDNCLNEIHQLIEGTKDPLQIQKRYRRRNGDTIWASVVGTVVRDTQQRPIFLVGQVQDITQRRQTEEALRQSENKFRLVVEQSLVGVYIIQHGRFVYVNPRLTEITGFSAEEMAQFPSVIDLVVEADRPLVQEQIRRRMAGEILSAHYTFHGRRKDGSTNIVEVLGTRTEFNGQAALLGTVLDITQHKRAEEALRATVEITPNVSVQWYDDDGRILFWNHASEIMFGWSAAETLGKTLDQFLLPPQDAALFRQTLARIAATGQPKGPREFQFTRRDHSTGYCLSTTFIIPSPAGQRRFVCMDVDITEQKNAETALHEISGQLLRLQDEEHRRIARELHDTTAQSLAALTMNLSFLQRTDPGQREKIQTVLSESLTLAERSLQEIRTLSYLLHPPELDVVGLRGAIQEYATGFARRSGIDTRVQIDPALRRLPPDTELALFRVVQEALGNILRHARSPTAQISLHTAAQHMTLEVSDQGIGIPEPRLAQINNLRGPVGVGFAGMRERLRQLGGQLEINSSTAGTTVRALVPVKE